MPPRPATASNSGAGVMLPPSTTVTAQQYTEPRGGPASAASLEAETLIGPSSGQLARSRLSPQSARTPNSRGPHHSSSHPFQQSTIPTTNAHTDNNSHHNPVNLDTSKESRNTRKDLLCESFFPDWKDDAASTGLGNPAEMQRQDPLATQIWKLYSKTKTQLPNQERMENLTWRMMAMKLKRKECEQARYGIRHHAQWPPYGA